MPAYDIAGGTQIFDLAATRGQNITNNFNRMQSRLLRQNADFYDRTGGSQAQDEQYNAETDRLKVEVESRNARTRERELENDIRNVDRQIMDSNNERAKASWDFYKQLSRVVTNAIEQGGPEAGETAFDSMLQSNPELAQDYSQGEFGKYQPEVFKAIAALEDPLEFDTVNYMYKGEDGSWKFEPMDRNKPMAIQGFIQRNPGGVFVNGVGNAFTGSELWDAANDDASRRELQTIERATEGVMRIVDEVVPQIEKMNAAQMGLPGGIIRQLDSAANVVVDVAGLFGGQVEMPDGTFMDDKKYYQTKLASFAGESAVLDRQMFMLAYLEARLDEPGGRFSDRDIDIRMRGLNNASKSQRIAVLRSIRKHAVDSLKFIYKQMNIPETDRAVKFEEDIKDFSGATELTEEVIQAIADGNETVPIALLQQLMQGANDVNQP